MLQKRFVSWAAVSSLPQAKKISVDDQLKTNLEHIEKWEGVLYKELPIRGKSRSITSWDKACATIPEYAKLRDMIERREFDVLIYLDRSRLGRKSLLIDTIVEHCHEAGIVTYATESPPDSLESKESSFHNKIVGAIESVMAQEEVAKMNRRHEFGMAARVRNGHFPGKIPFGWTVRYEVIEDSKPVQIVEIDEDAKATIELIYDMYLNGGKSFRAISDHLLVIGSAPPRGEPWTRSIVEVVIGHAWRYAGFVELNKRSKKREYIRAKSRWPSLITEDMAKKVVAERKRRANAKRAVDSVHLFSQIVWCDLCDKKMHARYNWRVSRRDPSIRKQVEDFVCAEEGISSHTGSHISGLYLIDAVRKAIAFVQVDENRALILGQYSDRTPDILRQIAKAKTRLDKHEEAVQRADDAYVMGRMSMERYQRQVDKLEGERGKVVAEIARLQEELEEVQFDGKRAERLLELASEGLQWLESPDLAAANAWFRRHIKLVILHNNPNARIDIVYL